MVKKLSQDSSEVGIVAGIRGGGVVAIMRSSLDFALTLGYDSAGYAVKVPTGWLVDGITYPDQTDPPDSAAVHQTEQQALNAIDQLTAYLGLASPTNAQTLAAVRMLCQVCIYLVKWRLGRPTS